LDQQMLEKWAVGLFGVQKGNLGFLHIFSIFQVP
jgi:hypothetical protein